MGNMSANEGGWFFNQTPANTCPSLGGRVTESWKFCSYGFATEAPKITGPIQGTEVVCFDTAYIHIDIFGCREYLADLKHLIRNPAVASTTLPQPTKQPFDATISCRMHSR